MSNPWRYHLETLAIVKTDYKFRKCKRNYDLY